MATDSRELTVELDSGKLVTVGVTVELLCDNNYGADADGNRGTKQVYINHTLFTVPNTDDDGDILSQDEKDEVEKLVDEQINEEDWEYNDDKEYEHDFD